jgi:hypothetical protein
MGSTCQLSPSPPSSSPALSCRPRPSPSVEKCAPALPPLRPLPSEPSTPTATRAPCLSAARPCLVHVWCTPPSNPRLPAPSPSATTAVRAEHTHHGSSSLLICCLPPPPHCSWLMHTTVWPTPSHPFPLRDHYHPNRARPLAARVTRPVTTFTLSSAAPHVATNFFLRLQQFAP